MDGNRRFARDTNRSTTQAHDLGAIKLTHVLEWCHCIGIHTVTVFAFSIDNFNRSSDEVDALFKQAEHKFKELLQSDLVMKHDVSVRVLGELNRLPKQLQSVMAQVVYATRNNTKGVLNLCFAYTSELEIECASNKICTALHQQSLLPRDVSESLLSRTLYSRNSPPVDLLLRTSGEKRLSDFLLWQSTFACLSFVSVYWPDFSLLHFAACILDYQRQQPFIRRITDTNHCVSNDCKQESTYVNASEYRIQKFLRELDEVYWRDLERIIDIGEA